MPAVTPWEDDVLQKLVSDPNSCIFLDQKRIPVVLQPFHLQDLKSAVRDLLNESVDSYDKSLNGILLSYKRLKVTNKSAHVAAETSGVVLDIEADFYVFRPEVGSVIKGIVNKISNDHVGALLHHRFNVSCPRPNSEARSEKWLGNKVVMHQEVTLKVKEKTFSGRMPFFKGKLLEIGPVLTPHTEEEDKKSKKKKKKSDSTVEASLLEISDMPESSSTPAPKKRKHKLEETEDEIKVKKSKKELKSDDIKSTVERNLSSVQDLPAMSSSKKKKKISIGSVDEIDFIPRLSLDVSQLPEDLPPPNADSTHFDLAKANSSLTGKSEKKKNKTNNLGLSAIREESSDVMKGISNANSNMDLTGKSQKSTEEKEKKKKKEKQDESKHSDSTVKEKKKKEKKERLTQDEMQVVSSNVSSSISKKEQKVHDQEPLPKKEKKAKKGKEVQSQPNPDANALHASDAGKELQTPSKSKKKQKEKGLDISSLLNLNEGKKHTPTENIYDNVKDLQSSSKSKKKQKEEKSLSPTKHSKKMKEKEPHDILTNDTLESDDTIPPGQKIIRESPVKPISSTQKRTSLSVSFSRNPEISYFVSGDSVMNLGGRKGDRQTPLLFGTFDGKIIPPPESPSKLSSSKRTKYDSDSDSDAPSPKKTSVLSPKMVLSPKKRTVSSPVRKEHISSPSKNTKKYDSDSDSEPPSPKKLVVTSSFRKVSSDSDDSGDDAAPSNSAKRVMEDSDSDTLTAAQSKLLQSMGVMQSPLKTAKPNVKQDTSESDSEGSVDTKANNAVFSGQNKSLLPKSDKSPTVNSKSKKSILANNNSLKKASPVKATQASKTSKSNKATKGKEVPAPVIPSVDNSDSDSDMEVLKRALSALASKPSTATNRKRTNSQSKGESKKVQATPSKKTPNKPKPIAKSTPEPVRGVESSVSKNLSNIRSDSDSGPDDRNTTLLLSQMREQKENELKGKKKQPTAKQAKGKKASESISEKPVKDKSKIKEPKKNKSSKQSDTSKAKAEKDVESEKKPKSRGKKKPSADEEISDVMQRLLRQAKMNVGLS